MTRRPKMARYRVDDPPRFCSEPGCGRPIEKAPDGYTWRHSTSGVADHAPRVAQ